VAAAPHHHHDQEPASKRQRRDDEHIPLWEVLKTTKPVRKTTAASSHITTPTLSRTISARQTGRPSISKDSSKKSGSNDQARLKVKEVIDITSSVDDDTRNVDHRGGVFNSSPVKQAVTRKPQPSERPVISPRRQESPIIGNIARAQPQPRVGGNRDIAMQPEPQFHLPGPSRNPAEKQQSIAQRSPLAPVDPPPQVTHIRSLTTTPNVSKKSIPPRQQRRQPSSPPVSTTSHISAEPVEEPSLQPRSVKQTAMNPPQARPRPPAEPLRLAAAAPRNTLLCQTLPIAKLSDKQRRNRSRSPAISVTANPEDDTTATDNKEKPLMVENHKFRQKNAPKQIADDIESSPAFEVAKNTPRPKTSAMTSKPAAPIIADMQTANHSHRRDTTPREQRLPLPPAAPPSPRPHALLPDADKTTLPTLLYNRAPADYSLLDAQLLQRPALTTKPDPPLEFGPQERERQIAKPIATITTNVGSRNVKAPFRPLRRATSDTSSISPRKSAFPITDTSNGNLEARVGHAIAVPAPPRVAPFANNNPPNIQKPPTTTTTVNRPSTTRPFRRAETHTGVPAPNGVTRVAAAAGAGGALGLTRPRAVQIEVQDPWTHEAWDLMGWIPAGKMEVMGRGVGEAVGC